VVLMVVVVLVVVLVSEPPKQAAPYTIKTCLDERTIPRGTGAGVGFHFNERTS